MGSEDRPIRQLQRILYARIGKVRDIERHAEPVHFPQQFLPVLGQALRSLPHRRTGQLVVAVPCKRGGTHAEPIQIAKDRRRCFAAFRAFYGQQRGDSITGRVIVLGQLAKLRLRLEHIVIPVDHQKHLLQWRNL